MCALKSGMHVAVMGGRGGTIHAWTVCVCLDLALNFLSQSLGKRLSDKGLNRSVGK